LLRQHRRGEADLSARVLLSFLALAALGSPSLAGEPLRLEDRVVLIKASPGCVNREEFDRLVDIAQQHEEAAFVHYVRSHKCPVLEAGTTGIYKDGGFRGRAMCIRPAGESECLWIPSAAAQKAD
jgi:hypothetical protein